MKPTDAPIFVIGTPRSGTTLTARILGRHSGIFMPGETHFFPYIYADREYIDGLGAEERRTELMSRLGRLYRQFNEPDDQERVDRLFQDPAIVSQLEYSLGDYQSAFSMFMAVQMQAENKRRWGNNTPKDLFYASELLAFFPDARFIVCVRDPRDFLASYQDKWKVTAEDQVDRLKRLYHPIVTTMLWKSSMRLVPQLRTRVPPGNLYVSRYEALVNDPENCVREMCAVIGEPFEPQMLEVQFSNSSEQASAAGIYVSSTGKWRERLTPEETWLAQRLTRSEMAALGYEADAVRVSYSRLIGIALSTPFALWRALLANRHNNGPIIPYLIKRVSSLIS